MFQSLLIKAVVGAILEWLKSLWDDLLKAARHREEGRKEVKDALEKDRQEADKEMERIADPTPTDLDGAIERMRARSRASGDY